MNILDSLTRCQASFSAAKVEVNILVVIGLSASGSNFLSTISLDALAGAEAGMALSVLGAGETPIAVVTISRSLIQMLPSQLIKASIRRTSGRTPAGQSQEIS